MTPVVIGNASDSRADVTPSTNRFTGVADARVVAVNVTLSPSVIFPQLIDGGSSVAQAALDSLGTSTAFAADPYPGETVVLAPGLIAGLTNGLTSDVIPSYPLIASSSHPSAPTTRREAGSMSLEARSEADSSRGLSRNGANTGTAEVSFDAGSGTVTASADASIGTIRVSDLLSFDGVRSTATASQSGSGDVDLESSFDVAGVTVGGQHVAFLDDALTGPSGSLPAVASALQLLLTQMADDGTTVELVPATSTDNSITSAALVIRTTAAPPPEVASGVETVVVEVILGRTTAQLDNETLPVPAVAQPNLTDGVEDLAPSSPGGTGAGTPSGSSGTAVGPHNDGPHPPSPGDAETPGAGLIADISIGRVYPVLVLAGFVLVSLANVLRILGVSQP